MTPEQINEINKSIESNDNINAEFIAVWTEVINPLPNPIPRNDLFQ